MEHFSQIAQRNVGALKPPQGNSIIDGEVTVIFSLDQLSEQALITEQLFIISANQTLIHALELGKIYTAAKNQLSQREFEAWLGNSTKKIGLSQAYNFISLSEKEDLQKLGVQSNGLLLPSHLVALFSAPEQVIEQVKEKVEAGEKISVAEINRYKKAAKQAEKEASQARKDADEWRVSMQTQQKINERNNGLIETKAQELLKTKQAEIEQKALTNASAEYQAKIDAQTDKISELRNQLNNGEKAKIEAEIEALKATRKTLQGAVSMIAYENELRNIAAHVQETMMFSRTELIAAGTTTEPLADNTFNMLMDAHEALDKLSQLFFNLANPAALTIED